MNNRTTRIIKNASYTIGSNFISLFISTLVILIIPKLVGVAEYGYLQLYIFYSSYVFLANLGWNDGIYLRYGGQNYKDLDKPLFLSQFHMMVWFQILLSASAIAVATLLKVHTFILFALIACMFLTNVRAMLHYTMLATNRLQEHAKSNILDRLLYCIVIVAALSLGFKDHKYLIMADLFGKSVSLLYAVYCCKDIVVHNLRVFKFNMKETASNINAGIKLVFADVASILNIGIIRVGIERAWDVTTFGKVSLTLSISNMFMLFINALSLVLFPLLRRSDEEKYPGIYLAMRSILLSLLFGILIFYWPLKLILNSWLPQYTDSISYLAMLFPLCLYEGRMSLLVNTFLKTLRKEKLMISINLLSLGFSFLMVFITIVLIRNLDMAVFSILLVSAVKCIISEIKLARVMGLSLNKELVLESGIIMIFILTSWFYVLDYSILVYAATYAVYLLFSYKKIMSSVRLIKGQITS
ncbi:hypothetical protein C2I18_02510 [Paenibacillus sp. PK3_47]|uniref:hypothetical protein n=1 Tax=Paenibacillus sp. PK3_47 TaxID=2072642 RepID=UPI00201DD676|nr:hypothetical protein [Paenibacillus sp. PK3_47]UQZ32525.1 hypothetical protein C2I18_02510 [Paenibacillus sp. PK3_47]